MQDAKGSGSTSAAGGVLPTLPSLARLVAGMTQAPDFYACACGKRWPRDKVPHDGAPCPAAPLDPEMKWRFTIQATVCPGCRHNGANLIAGNRCEFLDREHVIVRPETTERSWFCMSRIAQ